MSFLDNLAIRRAERGLRPFMRPDERIIEYDIANVEQIGSRIPVVLTNRAVYFVDRDAVRVPYEHILDLQAQGRALVAFATKSGNTFVVEVVGSPKGDFYETISHHLDKVIRHQQLIGVPGGQVLAVCRRLEEDGKLAWVLQASAHISLDAPDVRSALRTELGSMAERLGVPLPWD